MTALRVRSTEKRYKRIGWVVRWKDKKGQWDQSMDQFHRLRRWVIKSYEAYSSSSGSYRKDRKRGLARCVPVYVEVKDV